MADRQIAIERAILGLDDDDDDDDDDDAEQAEGEGGGAPASAPSCRSSAAPAR